jgi:hypothetical protein
LPVSSLLTPAIYHHKFINQGIINISAYMYFANRLLYVVNITLR